MKELVVRLKELYQGQLVEIANFPKPTKRYKDLTHAEKLERLYINECKENVTQQARLLKAQIRGYESELSFQVYNLPDESTVYLAFPTELMITDVCVAIDDIEYVCNKKEYDDILADYAANLYKEVTR
ncbi:MAG: hypothetical protein ACRDCE_00905 [Cetobacterium sp.]|uniref:hypothetical protein n=1 Tax=Cetobacterium sp. TaxID=2071632 RepID=UPI003EE4CDFF